MRICCVAFSSTSVFQNCARISFLRCVLEHLFSTSRILQGCRSACFFLCADTANHSFRGLWISRKLSCAWSRRPHAILHLAPGTHSFLFMRTFVVFVVVFNLTCHNCRSLWSCRIESLLIVFGKQSSQKAIQSCELRCVCVCVCVCG